MPLRPRDIDAICFEMSSREPKAAADAGREPDADGSPRPRQHATVSEATVIPVVTPARMAEIDAGALEPVEVLIERAGSALARAALDVMGGRYGRRVVVVAGPGNNGADGRAAAVRLNRCGVRVAVVPAANPPPVLPAADLYIDAAFGTGLTRSYGAPRRARPEAPVLAADIPSGLDGLTGAVLGGPVWEAQLTVTFAALKPGLVLGSGPELCGQVVVADIGLAVGAQSRGANTAMAHPDQSRHRDDQGSASDSARKAPRTRAVDRFDDSDWCALMQDDDVAPLPRGAGDTHKWTAAALLVAGSSPMAGAAALAAEAALRSGARMLHLSAPADVATAAPAEAVCSEPPLAIDAGRFGVCAVGPGLGLDDQAATRLGDALAAGLPTVVDADGLRLLHHSRVAGVLERRRRDQLPLVLTPHDGEFEALTAAPPGTDRIAAARGAAAALDAVVLLKGGPTVIASPDGRVRVVNSGDARLATAGSGDVLTGMIAGRLAALGPHEILERVAEAAHLHGRAVSGIRQDRITATDLLKAVSKMPC